LSLTQEVVGLADYQSHFLEGHSFEKGVNVPHDAICIALDCFLAQPVNELGNGHRSSPQWFAFSNASIKSVALPPMNQPMHSPVKKVIVIPPSPLA
jgi:hypothetical protein